MTGMQVRRFASVALAGALFLGILVGGVDWTLFKYPLLTDLEPLRDSRYRQPDRRNFSYRLFLDNVKAKTPEDATIALAYSVPDWFTHYGYAFLRATYLLAPRKVWPTLTSENEVLSGPLTEARYIAAWRADITTDSLEAVWSGEEGTLWLRH